MDFITGDLAPNTPHLFADLAELLLMTGYIGRNSLHTNDLASLLADGAVDFEDLDIEQDAEVEAAQKGQSSSEKSQRQENQLEEVFKHLSYRAQALKAYYPFVVANNTLSLVEPAALSLRYRVYRLLLACSRLRSFEGATGIRQHWAKAFTQLSQYALAGLAPKQAEVRIFDANSTDRRDYYGTDLRKALNKLGQDLAVLTINGEECQKAGSSGDAGLDLVAVVNFDDGAATSYALLAQCGAQETGWPQKTLAAHALRFRSYFQMPFDYPSVMFTPVCYRTATGEWTDNQAATGVLLLDRGRILSLLDAQDCWQAIVEEPWFLAFENGFLGVNAQD
ncbi:hypothetical protein KFZ76_01895 [Methylovulum psychrotolerans]|uniref:hypothetical protein n=1 Tax=Methylovulum psychrotolerans TaxID=1704499 RepID=UPI001BFF6735|nr:hypothetical protein [Methylovulum psychrotolerans]MBT9096460.1 hypothetical protein [Methylovulum psychrotolerans]